MRSPPFTVIMPLSNAASWAGQAANPLRGSSRSREELLTSLGRVMEDMARRSARFHLTLGDITRSTEASPEMFLRYKHALLAHMGDFMAELDRYLPRLTLAVIQVEATGLATLLNRAAEADERPLMRYEDVLDDWRRRWAAVRAWFTADGEGSRAAELAAATRAGVSSVIALLRQITEAGLPVLAHVRAAAAAAGPAG